MGIRNGRWDGSTDWQRITAADNLAGYPSGLCRQYLPLTQSFTGSYIQHAVDHGRIPIINLHSWTDGPRHAIPWLNVADGMFDDVLLANFTDFARLGVLAYFIFHHEPENDVNGATGGDLPPGESCGTRSEFVAASARVRDLMRSVLPASQALFGVTLMQGRFASGEWSQWVPLTYHFLGIDGYSHGKVNKAGVNTETFSNIFTPAHQAAASVQKALLIQECGVAETPGAPAFKPNFYDEMRSLTKSWPELLGICTSNVSAKEDYRIDTTPASLAAYQALAGDPYFQGDWS